MLSQMAERLSVLCTGRTSPPRNIFWYTFLLEAVNLRTMGGLKDEVNWGKKNQ
jgi:hypothetical protein